MAKSDKKRLSLVIDSVDPELVDVIQEQLGAVGVERSRPTRAIVTVLTIAAAAAQLTKAILDLKKALEQKPDRPNVTVINIDNRSVPLSDVTAEKIAQFLHENKSPRGK